MELMGKLKAGGLRIGIVISRFNETITNGLLEGALVALKQFGVKKEEAIIVRVPGAFEIPLAAQQLAMSKRVDAIICLGAIIKGATAHFDLVATQAAGGIARVSLDYQLPVIFEILATETIEQAIERSGTKAGNKGYEAVLAAVEMVDLMHQLREVNRTSDSAFVESRV